MMNIERDKKKWNKKNEKRKDNGHWVLPRTLLKLINKKKKKKKPVIN